MAIIGIAWLSCHYHTTIAQPWTEALTLGIGWGLVLMFLNCHIAVLVNKEY